MITQNQEIMEEWKEISDYPNYKISSNGKVVNIKTGKQISVSIHKHGHHVVRLWCNNKTRLFKLYRLLAIAFIPNPENKREVNHIDGNRMNYKLLNLEWATPSENMQHAVKTGLARGQFTRDRLMKLDEKAVADIKQRRANRTATLKQLGIEYNVTPDHICRISKGKYDKK